jgi:AcrR family transcriptional regulator
MRADGQRNRTAILTAAATIFAEQGFDVALEVIATKAGVSRMTLYRNFPDRESLVLAIFEQNMTDHEVLAKELQGRTDGFFVMLEHILSQLTDNAAFGDMLTHDPRTAPRIMDLSRRCISLLVKLSHAAKSAGLLRKDLTGGDIQLLLVMLGAAIRMGETHADRARRRQHALNLVRIGIGGDKR